MTHLRRLAAVVGLTLTLMAVSVSAAMAAPGDGTADSDIQGAEVGDVVTTVTDQGFEHLPTVLTIFAAILAFGFAVGLTAIGTRKALAKLRMLVRSA